MPKMKTHKGILKRMKFSARGKVLFKRPNGNHLMSAKSGKRCRNIRGTGVLSRALSQRLLLAVGAGRRARRQVAICGCGCDHTMESKESKNPTTSRSQ